jgi:hypothetical protein
VKHRPTPKKKQPHAPPLNLSGVKFEDALRKMLNTPPMRKEKSAAKS